MIKKQLVKSIISMLVVIVLVVALSSCGSNSSTMLTFKKDGETIEQLTVDELLKKIKESANTTATRDNPNPWSVDELDGCIVSGEGTITDISYHSGNSLDWYGNWFMFYTITINDEVELQINEESYIECYVGDHIVFEQEFDNWSPSEGKVLLWDRVTDHEHIEKYYDISY